MSKPKTRQKISVEVQGQTAYHVVEIKKVSDIEVQNGTLLVISTDGQSHIFAPGCWKRAFTWEEPA